MRKSTIAILPGSRVLCESARQAKNLAYRLNQGRARREFFSYRDHLHRHWVQRLSQPQIMAAALRQGPIAMEVQ